MPSANDVRREPLRLLSLDGGGIRGLSSLIILKHLMKRVNPGNPPKPCDYFHLIGGTSTGGLIAIMLGRLEMDVQECIDKYLQLSSAAFTPKRHKMDLIGKGKDLWKLGGKYRSDNLSNEFKAASKDIEGDEDAQLFHPGGKCRVFVCTQSKSLNAPVLLRSYVTDESIDGLSTSGIKIWEAARATSAASTFFDPIRIGYQEFVDGATGRNNPVESVLTEANVIWPDSAWRIQCLVSIGTGKSEFRNFGDNLADIKRTLVSIATETEETEQRIYRNQESLGVGGRYFRFNVDRGLEGVVLDEYEKQGIIIAATETYLETPRAKELIVNFINARPTGYEIVNERDVETYLNWLPYNIDPRKNHNMAKDLRADHSTGQWFLMGQFHLWRKGNRPFMWLHARAGSGKTVLSSTIIDTLERASATVVFFYFSVQREPISLQGLKQCLLVQLLKKLIKPSKLGPDWHIVPVAFVEFYRKYRPSREPDMEDVDRVFLDLLELAGEACIVLDALDECVPQQLRSSVIRFLGAISQSGRGNPHILVTSRREPDIEESIYALPLQVTSVPLSVISVNRDISRHLESFMKLSSFQKWSEGLKFEVLNYLTMNADGVFRWADLQIRSLVSQEREKDVRKALKRLPKDLETTYQRMLRRIQDEDKFDEAFAILRWLLCSSRPLTLLEAAEIAAFEVDDPGVPPESPEYAIGFYPSSRFMEASAIQRLLSGLVRVDEEESDEAIISFAHSSVRDYLCSKEVLPLCFRVTYGNSNWFILRACLAYVAHYDDAKRDNQRQPPYPLLGYSCQRAVKHLFNIQLSVMDKRTLSTIVPTMLHGRMASTLQARYMARELEKAGINWDPLGDTTTPPFLPEQFRFDNFGDALDMAAAAGQPYLVALVLDASTTKHGSKHRRTRALHAAALKTADAKLSAGFLALEDRKSRERAESEDYPAVVRALVSAGYDVNHPSRDGRTPLHLAAAAGHIDVAAALLQFPETDILAVDFRDQTPLIIAAGRGHCDIVALLLDSQRIRVNHCDEEGRTALSWAAAGGHERVVQTLLERADIDVNMADHRGRTPLIWASSLGRDNVVKSLLDKPETQPDARDFLGRTAASYAALRGHVGIFTTLLDRGDVMPNQIDAEGRSILALAESRGRKIKQHLDSAHDSCLVNSDSIGSDTTLNPLPPVDLVLRGKAEGSDNSQATTGLQFDDPVELGNYGKEVWHIRFSNDGRQLATCGDFDCVVIWDVRSRRVVFKLKGHEDPVTAMEWSRDDSFLLTTSRSQPGRHGVRLWDADPAIDCIWMPDQHSFLVAVDDPDTSLTQVTISENSTTQKVWAAGYRYWRVTVCGNQGERILACTLSNLLHIYETSTGKLQHSVELQFRVSTIFGSKLSLHGLILYSNGVMVMFDALTGSTSQITRKEDAIRSSYTLWCCFGGLDESLAVQSNEDGSISIFDRAAGEIIARVKGHNDRCNSVHWSPTNPWLFASASDDGRVILWNCRSSINNQDGLAAIAQVDGNLPSLKERLRLLRPGNGFREYGEFLG